MNETSLSFIDKSKWYYGPWNSEPDKVTWNDPDTGFDCIVRRGPLGAWCGYVAVTKSHPLFGKPYDDVDENINIHGGLSFSDFCDENDKVTGVCHISKDDDHAWWFGFDTAHWDDIIPAYLNLHITPSIFLETSTYKDLFYIKEETKKLAKQLERIGHE